MGHWLLWLLVSLFSSFIIWANYLELDILTRGAGSVVPSKSVYVVDNLEGGILAEINVVEGKTVEKGQQLLRIDNSSYLAALQENKQKQSALSLMLLRLRAEMSGESWVLPTQEQYDAAAIQNEQDLYLARQQQFEEKRIGYRQQIADTRRELYETKASITRLQAELNGRPLLFSKELQQKAAESVGLEENFYRLRQKQLRDESERLNQSVAILKKEYETSASLEKSGAASEMEVLEIKREIIDTQSRLAALNEDFLHKASQELKERRERQIAQLKTLSGFESSLNDLAKQRQAEIATEIRDVESERVLLQEQYQSLQDKVKRSTVYAPMVGIVNKVHLSNPGAVIQPGSPIVEIVPSTDTLLVEAQVAPQDIAFVRPRQKAVVKVTAYDFAVYGGLDGEVVFISPDTHKDDQGNPFYKVQVKTDRNFIGVNKNNVIIPGMSVEVDMISGKRSLLDYLLKPVTRISEEAMREH